MKRILERIRLHASQRPQQLALEDTRSSLTYQALQQEIDALAEHVAGERVAQLMGNSCAWAVVDLAIQQRQAAAIPIPPFFSDAQLLHLITDAEPDLVVTDQPERLEALLHISPSARLEVAQKKIALFRLPLVPMRELPANTAKITYTSGTTGQPKGVCLSGEAIAEVSIALGSAVEADTGDRTLSVLPLATLLENIGGIYAPLYHGSSAALPDLASCGFIGSSEVQPKKLIAAFRRFKPTTTILVPQLLTLLVDAAAMGATLPASLRFMAVGGAPCSGALIERARRLGMPVYQGYGLSEAASVVSLNRPGEECAGSVGRPLPHARVRIAKDGEIVVGGKLFGGYLNGATLARDEWPTGDLGYLDEAGYLHITGRKKTAFATAYGRKVSPEWVETELTSNRTLLQAAVFGEARPYTVALLVPHPAATSAQINATVAAANARLPDYARIKAWSLADAPFSPHNGLARAPGSLDREAIALRYAVELESLYTGTMQHVAI
ncbi:MAG TPA: AMP-binding protein [Gammaproteobacteria bacterium]|jgi:long-subunit acyl-CoA synthetase (AMP-forming)